MTQAQKSTKISEYGLIGNCRSAALISRHGSIDWCCLPQFDSPSLFSAILDPIRGGCFSISPSGPYSSSQHYLEDTNILETLFETPSGQVKLTDFFTFEDQEGKTLTPDHEILRIVEGVSGEVRMLLKYQPRMDYGKMAARLEYRKGFGIICVHGLHILTLRGELFADHSELNDINGREEVLLEFSIRAGENKSFSLSYNEDAPAVFPPLEGTEFLRLEQTSAIWKEWIDKCQYTGPYVTHVRRSALALKLLTFAPSGAIVAAPTTSLPEAIGGVRNWDYRYCWLRDAFFIVRAFVSLGYYDEARAYVSWTLHATHLTRPKLQVLYSVYGEPSTSEKTLSWLSGYEKSQPVRVGNAAHGQFQLDVYGEVLDGFFALAPHLEEVDRATRKFLIEKGKVICDVWSQPDDGIWEARSGRSHHTYSKVSAWVALDRLIRLCKQRKWKAPLELFQTTAVRIREAIETQGYNTEIQSYTGTFGGTELDASLLIMPLVGYCEASSPRMVNTRRAISTKLARNGLISRYLMDETDDGLPGGEGSFGICSFWLSENLAMGGELDEAKQWFEGVLEKGNSLGLWSEEIDPVTNEFLGNYPQGFTHLGLISAALTLERASSSGRRA
jgi:GH15 family glucan-1,4-alpha-glucosidase